MEGSNTTNHSMVGISGPSTFSKIIFVLEGSIGLVGNLVVVFLFTRRRQWLSKPHNRCILNLAITDLLTALALLSNPRSVLDSRFYQVSSQNFLSREIYCRVLWTHMLPFILGNTSLNICVVLSLERWLAVRKPIVYNNLFKTKHIDTLIIFCWIAGFAFEIPVPLMAEGVYDEESIVPCRWTEAKYVAFSFVMLFGVVILPFGLIFAAYVNIYRGIKASIRFSASARNENLGSLKRLKKVTNMTAITSFLLAISWLPAVTNFVLATSGFHPMPGSIDSSNSIIEMTLRILVFSNPCLNPFIYVISNPEYRKAFKEIFC